MKRALLVLVLAACDGEVLGGTAGTKTPVKNLPPAVVEPEPAEWTNSAAVEVTAGADRFVTASWDLSEQANVPATASVDVRVLGSGEVELVNPRFALKASAARQLVFSRVRVGVGSEESAAYDKAFAIVPSVREAVLAPGLVAVSSGTSPLSLRLRFVVRETAEAPVAVGEMPVTPAPPPMLEEGKTYVLHSRCGDGSTVLAIEGGGLDDDAPAIAVLQLAGAREQQFTMVATTQGGVMLVARHSGRALNVPRGSLVAGTQLIQWDAADVAHPNQRWRYAREEGGSYRFEGVQSGLYVEVAGAEIVQAEAGAACAQRFVLERVE